MLDLSHPQTKPIFKAARIEDEIRVHLLAWRKEGADRSLSESSIDAVKASIAKPHALNQEHFKASVGITGTLAAVEAAITLGSCEESWQAFLRLAESPGANFSTWAI
jgi:hypothetical protein